MNQSSGGSGGTIGIIIAVVAFIIIAIVSCGDSGSSSGSSSSSSRKSNYSSEYENDPEYRANVDSIANTYGKSPEDVDRTIHNVVNEINNQ